MSDILDRVFLPSADAVESAVGEETVILHLGNGTYYGLDAVGTLVWAMLKAGIGTSDICCRLADQFGVERAEIEADVREFLRDLEAHDILIDG